MEARDRTPTLNEGRESNPGDTLGVGTERGVVAVRSTKAGSLTPATPDGLGDGVGIVVRSTKAGSLTPATLTSSGMKQMLPSTLNEGRESNPGDTGDYTDIDAFLMDAQRRPGV